jgi:ABC-type uncharacterized transport system permease subunit
VSRLRFEERPPTAWVAWTLPLAALAVTFVITAGAIALAGADPLEAYGYYLLRPLTTRFSALGTPGASPG